MEAPAATLSGYPVVMNMFGVGVKLGSRLMAEIGDEWFFVRFSAVLILWITVDNRVDGSN